MNGWKHRILLGFLALWRREAGMLHAQYQELSAKKHLLADIALRGGLHTTEFEPDPRKAAYLEGRRALALEIVTLAGTTADDLRKIADLHERNPK